MAITNASELLSALLNATQPSEVESILAHIGDNANLSVEEPFGPLGYEWHFFGDNPSNMSTINLGSKPGRSLTERVTNAIDAILERAMYQRQDNGHIPESPMEAVAQWFGRPPTTTRDGLFNLDPERIERYSNLVHVVMTPGDEPAKPTIDVMDRGIGICPDEFADTILSFHRGNKIDKRYLSGAFGQGGSATIAFSDYTLIVSRNIESPDIVGFTIVKLMELEENYKENAYVYLSLRADDSDVTIPSCRIDGPLDTHPHAESGAEKPPALKTGTVARHYGYQLRGLERPLSPSPNNLFHLLEHMLFDPLLPIRVVDLRKPDDYQNRIVIGSRNRLMSPPSIVEIRHHQPLFWVRPGHDEEQTLGVEYWVVFSSFKQNGSKHNPRVRPHDLFVDPARPIVGTLNGQNHGELTARIVKDAKLAQVAKHIIVHLDLTNVSKRVRSQLLSSTREGFKESEILSEVLSILQDHFRDDEQLHEIEAELEERLLDSNASRADHEVRSQIKRLLQETGLVLRADDGEMPFTEVDTEGNAPALPPTQTRERTIWSPQPTLPYPQVTRFAITRPKKKFRIHQNNSRFVTVETDADDLFDSYGSVGIRIAPNHLVDVSKSALMGGRIRWRMRPRKGCKPGDIGTIVAWLRLPDGSYMEERMPYEILPPRPERIKTAKGYIPVFDIQGVDPYENPDQFYSIWDYLDPAEDDITAVAYKVVETKGGLIVYYSRVFAALRKWLDDVIRKQSGLAGQFMQNYEVWIGYYAISQWQQHRTEGGLADVNLDEDLVERLQDREGAVVAEMQVKQALEVANLRHTFSKLT